MWNPPSKAIAFDLGDTLIEYEGVPLNWEAHYRDALISLSAFLGVTPTVAQLDQSCAILQNYNTRRNPRENEIAFALLLREILDCFSIETDGEEQACAAAFFRVFRQKLRCFPDVPKSLLTLRERGIKIGVFTDVPYGMPKELVLEDIDGAALGRYLDVLLTSRDTGVRKPSGMTLQALAQNLGCGPNELIHVGNERKDIEVARAVGCTAVLLDRTRQGHDWGQDYTISSLAELCVA